MRKFINIFSRAGLIILSLCFIIRGHAQTTVITDSIINHYQRITSIHSMIPGNPDSVFVEDASAFNKHEVVLFIVNKGMQDNDNLFNTGKYFLIYVDTVEYDNNLVIFNSILPGVNSLLPGERAQLVTVPRYKNLVVNEKLTCKPWDPITGTGGVLVFLVDNMLQLQADIDVSGKGFLGADPGDEQYEGSCSSFSPGYLDGFFSMLAKDSAGFKGDGIIRADYMFPRGWHSIGNSGGGGNGRFSGGGGGSNSGSGGLGGKESSFCAPGAVIGGHGGQSLSTSGFYTNIDPFYRNRIFMGGGGGAGTQDPSSGRMATPGGNGGGIVIFTANKVVAAGNSIKANGNPVTGLAGAGAGGGGGGGVVVADVISYSDPLLIEVRGGMGGNVLANADTTGPGGGGGGGIFWFSKSGFLPPNVTLISASGQSGVVVGTDRAYGATSGTLGRSLSGLVLPRQGFIMNKIPDDQIICQDIFPEVLNAPPAQGGFGPPFNYTWLTSVISSNGPWETAEGTNDLPQYSPPAMEDATIHYYKRVVGDGTLVDTSFAIIIDVTPRLVNNDFNQTDTVCAMLTAGTLSISSDMGGGLGAGTYNYFWEKSNDASNWQSAEGTSNLPFYETPVLNEILFYRRKVRSGTCVDTSNLFRIEVLPVLTNNLISDDHIICNGQQPSGLTGSTPAGGLLDDRRYQWELSTDLSAWNFVSDQPDFAPGNLTDTTYYRRIVYSGPNNTCELLSNTVSILVLPLIENNILFNSDSILCAGLPGITLNAGEPSGGDGNYRFIWQKRATDESVWSIARETEIFQSYQTQSLTDTTWFRRMVRSGNGNVCEDISDSVLINVLPVISNNIVSASQIICEGNVPVPVNGTLPAGGADSFIFEWQQSPDGLENWDRVVLLGDLPQYAPLSLNTTTFYRRAVFSGPANTCTDFSNELVIEVQPAIENNLILNGFPVSACYNTPPENFQGTTEVTGGDGENYTYLWEESRNLFDWSAASQANEGPEYQPEALTDPVYYRRVVSSGTCLDTTDAIGILIDPLPVLTSLQSSLPVNSICDDEELIINIGISDGQQPYMIQYTNSIDTDIFTAEIPGTPGSFLVNTTGGGAGIPNNYNLKLASLTDFNGCMASMENLGQYEVEMDVYIAARPVVNMEDTEEICGSSILLRAIPDAGNGVWRTPGSDNISFSDSLMAQTEVSLNDQGFNVLTAKFYYMESTPGCGERKDSVMVTFYEQPDDPVITNDTIGISPFIVFLSDNITLNSAMPTAGNGAWVISSGPGVLSSQNDTSALLTGLLIDDETNVVYTVTNGVCDVKSSFILIERKDVKIYEGFSPNGDMINDFLYAEGIDRSSQEMQYTFTIFNSGGAFIMELKNDTPLEVPFNNVIWDGLMPNGNLAADGTYYYVFKLNYKGSEFTYKGFFVIKSE